ncbi:hypothetical protein [Flavisolibacter nicotianae]|uniref:hypothetical protein n=1 Tax=Flavisolibacter nicotianae TaxID=2364882 RepID=UPI000EB5A339|nr:hypothetical protein [Flavisolibacter nicotianae]
MLNTISWAGYLSFVVLLLLVYYAVVGWRFYSVEIKDWLFGKRLSSLPRASAISSVREEVESDIDLKPVQPVSPESKTKQEPAVEEKVDILEQIMELTPSLKATIAKAVEKNYIKEEFFLSLQVLLKRYAFLKGTPSFAAINNLIASECEKYGYHQLSAEDCVLLWND